PPDLDEAIRGPRRRAARLLAAVGARVGDDCARFGARSGLASLAEGLWASRDVGRVRRRLVWARRGRDRPRPLSPPTGAPADGRAWSDLHQRDAHLPRTEDRPRAAALQDDHQPLPGRDPTPQPSPAR